MTYEEKVRWLWRYQDSIQMEKELQQELEMQRSRASCATSALTGMPNGKNPSSDKIARSVERIIELEESLQVQIDICTTVCRDVLHFVEGITDMRTREIFRYRYILGKTWEDIAEQMGLSSKWVKILHDRYIQL